LRRSESGASKNRKSLAIGNIKLDSSTREVWISGSPVDLTAMEFDLLDMLISSAGRVVTRREISVALFEREATPYDRFLDVHISHLRRKLRGSRSLIRTIRGVGYVITGMA